MSTLTWYPCMCVHHHLNMLLHRLSMPSSWHQHPTMKRPEVPTPCRWMFLGLAVVSPATLALAAGLPGELRGMSSNIVKLLDFGGQHPIYVPSKASDSGHRHLCSVLLNVWRAAWYEQHSCAAAGRMGWQAPQKCPWLYKLHCAICCDTRGRQHFLPESAGI